MAVERRRVFHENPYDVETFFESLSVASQHNRELLFVDRMIAALRRNPDVQIVDAAFDTLQELHILKNEHIG
jgi:hypothetical protein